MGAEHPIRLRGAWEFRGPDAPLEGRPRVSLPMTWPPGATGPVVLVRRFRRPPIDPARETLGLRMEDVPGLRAVRLNDRLLARPPVGMSALEFDLSPDLPDGNILTLEVDPAVAGLVPAWGAIALIIRPA